MNPNTAFKQRTAEVEEPEEPLVEYSSIIWVGSGEHKLYIQGIKERLAKAVVKAKAL